MVFYGPLHAFEREGVEMTPLGGVGRRVQDGTISLKREVGIKEFRGSAAVVEQDERVWIEGVEIADEIDDTLGPFVDQAGEDVAEPGHDQPLRSMVKAELMTMGASLKRGTGVDVATPGTTTGTMSPCTLTVPG